MMVRPSKNIHIHIGFHIENAKMHEERIAKSVPNKGSVRSLIVTEKQYASIHILVGSPKKKEKNLARNNFHSLNFKNLLKLIKI